MTVTDLAERLSVSRPTAYKMISLYGSGHGLDERSLKIMDACLGKEAERRAMYESRNGSMVVRIVDNTAENANGTFVKGSETRGKRDIVAGEVVIPSEGYPIGCVVYFPYYASQPLTLDGEQLSIVDGRDVKFVKK